MKEQWEKITLLLICLNILQKELGINESIECMISSEARGIKSFNIQVEERVECLQNLFKYAEYTPKDGER